MGFSVSTIRSLKYNRGQRRHRSSMKDRSDKVMGVIKEQENTIEDSSRSVGRPESTKKLPFIVKLWNWLK